MQELETALEKEGGTTTPLDYQKCNTNKNDMPHLEPACPAYASKAAPTPPPQYPAACLHEQCVHYYCDPITSPDLFQLFPMHMEGKLRSAPNVSVNEGWPEQCALRYCVGIDPSNSGTVTQIQGCTQDSDCKSIDDSQSKCVQECGESGYGCSPLWHNKLIVCGPKDSNNGYVVDKCSAHTTVAACSADTDCKPMIQRHHPQQPRGQPAGRAPGCATRIILAAVEDDPNNNGRAPSTPACIQTAPTPTIG